MSEQTHFSAEDDGVQLPVSLPADVLAILQKQESDSGDVDGPPNASMFSASRIHLGPGHSTDLIVQSTVPGANVVTLWVFVQSNSGWHLALTVPAHDLIVRHTRSHGYRNIKVDAMNCCTITKVRFRYNGSTYEHFSTKVKEIK